jgi:hypothetical protein
MGKRENVQLLVKRTEKIRAKLKFPLYVQDKLNGVRALIYKADYLDNPGVGITTGLFDEIKEEVIIESSEGNHYEIEHIKQFCKVILDRFNVILDGELYIHGEPLNRIIRRLPKTNAKGTVSKASLHTPDLEFHIFDIKNDKTQKERLELLETIGEFIDTIKFNSNDGYPVKIVTTYLAEDLQEAEMLLNTAIDNGYEGIVFRYPNSYYAAGKNRQSVGLKWKKFVNTECEVLDIISEGMKNGVYVLKALLKNDINDETFLCNFGGADIKFTNEYKEDIYKHRNDYIGGMCTIRFYERTGTSRKIPFHANIEILNRNYE